MTVLYLEKVFSFDYGCVSLLGIWRKQIGKLKSETIFSNIKKLVKIQICSSDQTVL